MYISSTIHDLYLHVVYSYGRNLLLLVSDIRYKKHRLIFISRCSLKPTERQSWVTSSSCVFLSKVLIIQTHTTHRSSIIVFYYKILLVSPVQISYLQVFRVLHKKIECNLIELYIMFRRIINILRIVSREYYLCLCSNGRNLILGTSLILGRSLIHKILRHL